MAASPTAVQLTEPVAHHGEGACWDGRGRWLSVDMLAGRIVVTDPYGDHAYRAIPEDVAAAVRPAEGGGLVVVGGGHLWSLPVDASEPARHLLSLGVGEEERANEAALTPDGGLAVGTVARSLEPGAGRVLTVTRDGGVRTAIAGTTVSNGTVFLQDGTVLFVDSPTRCIVRLQVHDDATWGEPEVAVDLRDQPGVPDGICADADGGIWVALWGGAQVQRWSAEGRKTHALPLPVSQPTSVGLGGPTGDDLLITSSAYELPPDHATPAGALFVAKADSPAGTSSALPATTLSAWLSRAAGGEQRTTGTHP